MFDESDEEGSVEAGELGLIEATKGGELRTE